MPKHPEYTLQDWLNLHQLELEEVARYCEMIANMPLVDNQTVGASHVDKLRFDFDGCLDNLVKPSLVKLLKGSDDVAKMISDAKISLYEPDKIAMPYTEYCKDIRAPRIHLAWTGEAKDIICLVHECAHAVQMLMSNFEFMPPIARETCAFLGELSLIRFARQLNKTLYSNLSSAWHLDNQHYWIQYLLRLVNGLKSSSSRYVYSHNYPLARVAAMVLFQSKNETDFTQFFASGKDALQYLNLPSVMQVFALNKETTSQHQSKEQDDDIVRLSLSLSSSSLAEVRCGQIDYAWIYRSANVGFIVDGDIVTPPDIAPHVWIKWRSMGVLALAALQRGKADLLPIEFVKAAESKLGHLPFQEISCTSPWINPSRFDALCALGMTIEMMASSTYHQRFGLADYLPVEILPPIKAGQFKCYLDQRGAPLGIMTWAWISEDELEEICNTGRSLEHWEWTSGAQPFINDWLAEPSAFKVVMREMRDSIFCDHTVTCLRRALDGSVQRVSSKRMGRKLQRSKINAAK